MKNLPLGISNFRSLIENKELYIDKTKDIYNIINAPKYLFLSRPRRFGKSLLISTLEEIFLGNKELFKDLSIYSTNYNWKKYPVIRIDFSTGIRYADKNDFVTDVTNKLKKIALYHGVEVISSGIAPVIEELIIELAKIDKVVILIDEYDSPILNNINNLEIMDQIRDLLREFYSTIKGLDGYIHKFFMTGVTKIAQTSLFSGSNQVSDISLLSTYQTILGYTQEELEFYFKDRITQVAKEQNITEQKLRDNIKFWYNGYNFYDAISKVYNPFSILSFFEFAGGKKRDPYENYWAQTGITNYLVDTARKNLNYLINITETLNVYHEVTIGNKGLNPFRPEDVLLEALLFQSGYLTIKGYEKSIYTLSYPNNEVRESLTDYLIAALVNSNYHSVSAKISTFRDSLEKKNLNLFFIELSALTAGIPSNLHVDLEKYYHSIVHTLAFAIGLDPNSEVSVSTGRSDLTIETKHYIYVIEFKINKTAGEALEQIKANQYYKKHLNSNKLIILLGISFNKNPNNIDWKEEILKYRIN